MAKFEVKLSEPFPKLNPEVKALWITALREGGYKQGIHRLRNLSDEYCCLGVLCEVYSKDKGDIHFKLREDSWSFDYQWGMPPEIVEKYADLDYVDVYDRPNVIIMMDGLPYSSKRVDNPFTLLSIMNDEYRWTFEEIATFIEEHL